MGVDPQRALFALHSAAQAASTKKVTRERAGRKAAPRRTKSTAGFEKMTPRMSGALPRYTSRMLQIETIHHVSLSVTDLPRAKSFYAGVLELVEIERPAFDFPGAWYRAGDRRLHLIVGEHSTFRDGKGIDSRDGHFAVRVASYRGALQHLIAKGYSAAAGDEMMKLRENPTGRAGFPQIYILDPDRNVIEINAERLD